MSRIPIFYLVLIAIKFLVLVNSDPHIGVCDVAFCSCTPDSHPMWTTINCTVPYNEKLDILEGDLPDSTTDLIVTGGEAVRIGSNTLSKLKDLRHLRISGPRLIMFARNSAIELNVLNSYIEIEKCDVLRFEERTFVDIKGPLTVTITDCDTVLLESEAFSWLLSISIKNVRELELSSGSFMLDPTADNVGEHGPSMSIELKNLSVPQFAKHTFGSSTAKITLDLVKVDTIQPEAFSANTYNIIQAINCSFGVINEASFTQKSLINNLNFSGCKIHHLAGKALQSAVGNLKISETRFETIETGAINTTVASVVILDSVFKVFQEKGFKFSDYNNLTLKGNSFDELAPNAIVAPFAFLHNLAFIDNEIETVNPSSLGFIGQALTSSSHNIVYKNNYYGQTCHCNITQWLAKALDAETGEPFATESYCTIDVFFAKCFNVPEQNMLFQKFIDRVCGDELSIKCEAYKSKTAGVTTEIKNPRFPHKKDEYEVLTDWEKKVIGIVIGTIFGCALIFAIVSIIKCMRRKGYCRNIKDFLISSNSVCGSICDRFCVCDLNSGLDNAGSISQLSVNEYSERHRLNEPRDIMQETVLPITDSDEPVPMEDKSVQTLPEELTRELIENLREKLEDPENYAEASEMIQHLYQIMKDDNVPSAPPAESVEENIYELPFQNTPVRVGKNKKQMVSVGTKTPSLEQLFFPSPYNRPTALARTYFEPKDAAEVHLYAEIPNSEKDKKNLLSAMPDVIGEQAVPRGPYLSAVREKMNSNCKSMPTSPATIPHNLSTIKSNKSTASNSSDKMMNRPLPKKPIEMDPQEGTSYKRG